MNNPRPKKRTKGVLLIICLLVMLVLTSICLLTVSSIVTTNKASKYSSAKFEAQQKADAIANFAVSQLVPNHSNDITPCDMAKSCLVWSSQLPASAYLTTNTAAQKTWWGTYAQDYPNATQLQSLSTPYSSTTGANPTDTVASFIVTQDAQITDASGYAVRTLRIVSYATDSKGSTAAVKQQFYTYVSNCKSVTGGTPDISNCPFSWSLEDMYASENPKCPCVNVGVCTNPYHREISIDELRLYCQSTVQSVCDFYYGGAKQTIGATAEQWIEPNFSGGKWAQLCCPNTILYCR